MDGHATLAREDWLSLRGAHERAVDQLTAARRTRIRHQLKHPVEDFLFDYYPIRIGHLRRWNPGVGTVLAEAPEFRARRGYRSASGTTDFAADPRCFLDGELANRGDHAVRVRELLVRTSQRPPRYACFGLHEWAMVLGLDAHRVRHTSWRLRVSPSTVRTAIDDSGLACTHFDAFRFFTAEARPRNPLQLTRADQLQHEQPGCLHAGMDLYRWAFELQPIVSSDLVLRCFRHAADARRIDMRASPYDLVALGLQPIPVETAAGRAVYATEQRRLAAHGASLRQELLDSLELAELPAAPRTWTDPPLKRS